MTTKRLFEKDHPRVCGEKLIRKFLFPSVEGSPPRVRGEVYAQKPISFTLGITPACAGRSYKKIVGLRDDEDHPRVCGEKLPESTRRTACEGSPPRVRGEDASLGDVPRVQRITPACAGRSNPTGAVLRKSRDHPRVCGEKRMKASEHQTYLGSPPRVRGEGPNNNMTRAAFGITPACAGRSRGFARGLFISKDHPRVCGEKSIRARDGAIRRGSPPRVRGEVKLVLKLLLPLRITPACAGRRNSRITLAQRIGDHPRVCGEKFLTISAKSHTRGSPPRVRGEDIEDSTVTMRKRITPACAGRS